MASSVVGQFPIPGGAPSAPSFFSQNPIASVVGGTLRIDKAAVAARFKSAPGASVDEESLFLRIIEAIRNFLARICRAVLPAKFFSSPSSDNSRPDSTFVAASDSGPASMSESADAISVEGLPEWSLERVSETVEQMVKAASGEGLSNSVKAALAMPDLGVREAFRVLLQQNLSDTQDLHGARAELQDHVESMLGAFAEGHGLSSDVALELFKADLQRGGGVIADRVDPNGEIRGFVAQLKKVDEALAGLARARGTICTSAIESGSYAREDLVTLISAHGHDTAFLSVAEAVAAHAPEEIGQVGGNVVSLAAYRQAGAEAVPVDYTPPSEPPLSPVMKAIETLIEQGVVERTDAQEIAQAAAIEEVVSDESEFDFEAQGDDLGDFFKNSNAPKATPKP